MKNVVDKPDPRCFPLLAEHERRLLEVAKQRGFFRKMRFAISQARWMIKNQAAWKQELARYEALTAR